MANKTITELSRQVRESLDKLLNAVEQHEAVQKDLPGTEKAGKPADEPKTEKK